MENRKTIKGTLTDKNGKPVNDAVVMIVNGSSEFNDIASVSNDSGEFYISNVVVPGNYVLQINANNQTMQKEVVLSENDTSISVALK